MTDQCKALVVYKTKSAMSYNNIPQFHGKGVQHHQLRQTETHNLPDSEREDSEATSGPPSTYGDDGASGTFSGSPVHRSDADTNSLGNSIFYDDPDAPDGILPAPDPVLTAKAIERTKQKIESVKDQIRQEQISKEENVNEFLKLCANADRQQHTRMKQLFEKKNQKSAQTIAQLQRKLEENQRKLRDLEEHGVHQKPSDKVKERVQGLKNVGGNIMAKPKELAHRLRHRFGSADNLTTLKEKEGVKESRNPLGSSSLPRDNPGARGPAMYASEHQSSFDEDESRQSEKSDVTSESLPPHYHSNTII